MMKAIYRIALIGVLVLIFTMTINNTVFAGGKTIPQIIGEAKSQTTEVTVEEVKKDIPRMVGLYKARLEKAGVKDSRISTQVNLHSSSRAKDILTEAQEGVYGTIVMGRRGLSKVHEFLLGRVTNKVLHRAEGFAVWIVP